MWSTTAVTLSAAGYGEASKVWHDEGSCLGHTERNLFDVLTHVHCKNLLPPVASPGLHT